MRTVIGSAILAAVLGMGGCGTARMDYYGPAKEYVATHHCQEVGVIPERDEWDSLEGRIVRRSASHEFYCEGLSNLILIRYK